MKHAEKNSHSPSSLCILYTRQGEDVSVLVLRKFVLDHERLQSLALHAILKASQTSSWVCSWLSDMRVEHTGKFAKRKRYNGEASSRFVLLENLTGGSIFLPLRRMLNFHCTSACQCLLGLVE